MGEHRRLVLWLVAGALLCAAGAAILLLWRGGERAALVTQAADLNARHAKLFHPEQPEHGTPAVEALKAARSAHREQLAAAEEAGRLLAPPLPPAYLGADLIAASAQVQADAAALRQRSDRTRIAIPALPFQTGLDPDDAKRGVQLAQLHLCRLALDLALDCRPARVANLTLLPTAVDPAGTLAALACEIEVEGGWDTTQALLVAGNAASGRGLGLYQVQMEQTPDGRQRIRAVVVRLCPAPASWKLAGIRAAPASGGPSAAPGAPAPARLNRRGG